MERQRGRQCAEEVVVDGWDEAETHCREDAVRQVCAECGRSCKQLERLHDGDDALHPDLELALDVRRGDVQSLHEPRVAELGYPIKSSGVFAATQPTTVRTCSRRQVVDDDVGQHACRRLHHYKPSH